LSVGENCSIFQLSLWPILLSELMIRYIHALNCLNSHLPWFSRWSAKSVEGNRWDCGSIFTDWMVFVTSNEQ